MTIEDQISGLFKEAQRLLSQHVLEATPMALECYNTLRSGGNYHKGKRFTYLSLSKVVYNGGGNYASAVASPEEGHVALICRNNSNLETYLYVIPQDVYLPPNIPDGTCFPMKIYNYRSLSDLKCIFSGMSYNFSIRHNAYTYKALLSSTKTLSDLHASLV